jgi:hypothetical protein
VEKHEDSPLPVAAQDRESLRFSRKAILSLLFGLMLPGFFITGSPAIVLSALALSDIAWHKAELRGRWLAIGGILLGTTATIGALLIPTGCSFPKWLAQWGQSSNNLKEVGVAIQDYEYAHRNDASIAIDQSNSPPLLSWRVAVLPFFLNRGEWVDLYKQFDLQESWNGSTNGPLANVAPLRYLATADRTADLGRTNIVAIVGPDTVISPNGVVRIKDCQDGTNETIMAVELAGFAPRWTEPADVTIDEFVAAVSRDPSSNELRPVYERGVLCIFANGCVRDVNKNMDPAVLRALCTRAGGETIPAGTFE